MCSGGRQGSFAMEPSNGSLIPYIEINFIRQSHRGYMTADRAVCFVSVVTRRIQAVMHDPTLSFNYLCIILDNYMSYRNPCTKLGPESSVYCLFLFKLILFSILCREWQNSLSAYYLPNQSATLFFSGFHYISLMQVSVLV